MNTPSYHTPVMCEETEKYLINNLTGTYVDCTIGGGGHSLYLLERYQEIKIIGFDHDKNAIEESNKNLSKYSDRIKLVKENFKNIRKFLRDNGTAFVDGALADLGVSSKQLDDESKGFSFKSDNLDMRMDLSLEKNAQDIINTYDNKSLTEIFYRYGEERFAEKISRKIIEERAINKIISGKRLAEIVEKVKKRDSHIHPATKIFQALRIAVNKELENLSAFLADLPFILSPGGKAVIISYHSLEDRIIKNSFRDNAKNGIYKILTKKVITASEDEKRRNNRSRSAKLRAVEKL
ncbi:MAG: 16S rRNA (cytosine(1402)-N(4))-methyltransferase RsmH [Elusimicrobia bacterium]|nr:16S rRNA (cytosine(1402)-N(4))-methyltransferase RsmH [Elusimicrobiota bacterium]